MEFENSFEVPLPPAEAWDILLDVPRMARCMPGAEIVDVVDDRTYKGTVAVRLGPVTMNFAGTVNFTEVDSVAHRAVANARGNDVKGRGTASAVIRFGLVAAPEGSRVTINTVLSLTGAVAQYGRASGVIKELASQITLEFAQRLRALIDAEARASAAPQAGAGTEAAAANAAASALPASTGPASPPPVEGLSAGRLLWRALVAYLGRIFGRRPV